PDSLLMFTKHEEQDAFAVEGSLRNFPQIDPFVVRWQYPLMVPDTDLDPTKLKQAGRAKKRYTADQLLEVLGDESLTTTDWQKLAKSESGMSERTFYDLKSELQKLGRILQSKINNKWQKVYK